jgi:alkanesulfonate monooxygenase SsuD/methylene tetrahydromethanopterin reductase-like flavin-dependent oxidoreductase (luciferase family)
MRPEDLKIGLLLPSWTNAMDGVTPTVRDVVEIARHAEHVGFDTLWLADHFYFEPYSDFRVVGVVFPDDYAGVKGGAWECWTLATAIAGATSTALIGTLVSNTGYRNPALFARAVDTIDDFSGGRIILGLGAGDFETEHRSFGFPFERRVGRFEEALAIIVPLLRGEEVSFTGEFYSADRARLLPKAQRAGGPPIMIGTLKGGPRMSRLVVQHATMWNCNLAFGDSGTAAYRRAWAPILQACERHGRDPATLIRHATVGVNMTEDPYPVPGAAPFGGSPRQIADRLAEYAALGVEHVSIMPHPWTHEGIDRFAAVIETLRGSASGHDGRLAGNERAI